MEQTPRNHKVLEAIILSYAEAGLPVGSEFLLKRYPLGVSSATIRNVMADLEGQGLIMHPHTSAGRVPTDLGYRYYVDLLMERPRLSQEEQEEIESVARTDWEDPREILEEATRTLSELTQEAGVALAPTLSHGSFQRLELIPVGARSVVGVLISSEGQVKHARLDLVEPLSAEELERLEDFLNDTLEGMSLLQAQKQLELAWEAASDEAAGLWRNVVGWSGLSQLFSEDLSVILEGASWILEAPEFKDIQRTRRLVRGLENREELAGILQRDLSAEDVKLHIGSENRGTSLTDCTIAGAPYRFGVGVMGTIGVVGPTRMNYPRITALVGRMAQAVSEAFQGR